MHRRTPRVLTALRRHRGVWVLALAVLLFKVAMSTFCVLDGPRIAFTPDPGTTTVSAVSPLDDDGDLCVLDEGKGCHCTCAHAVALPTNDIVLVIGPLASRAHATLQESASPRFLRSPLRPPIA